jgi:hypothetical protein
MDESLAQRLDGLVLTDLGDKPVRSRRSSNNAVQDRKNSLTSSTSGSPSSSAEELFKTELCRSFDTTGACKYGAKCRFAHGQHELRPVARHPKYKTQHCKTFCEQGHCPYGARLQVHSRRSQRRFGGVGARSIGAHARNVCHANANAAPATTTTVSASSHASRSSLAVGGQRGCFGQVQQHEFGRFQSGKHVVWQLLADGTNESFSRPVASLSGSASALVATRTDSRTRVVGGDARRRRSSVCEEGDKGQTPHFQSACR